MRSLYDPFCRFRCTESQCWSGNTDPAGQRSGHVCIRLDHHTPASRQRIRLEPVLGQLQSRVWIDRRQLLARPRENASSDQRAALPTEDGVQSTLILEVSILTNCHRFSQRSNCTVQTMTCLFSLDAPYHKRTDSSHASNFVISFTFSSSSPTLPLSFLLFLILLVILFLILMFLVLRRSFSSSTSFSSYPISTCSSSSSFCSSSCSYSVSKSPSFRSLTDWGWKWKSRRPGSGTRSSTGRSRSATRQMTTIALPSTATAETPGTVCAARSGTLRWPSTTVWVSRRSTRTTTTTAATALHITPADGGSTLVTSCAWHACRITSGSRCQAFCTLSISCPSAEWWLSRSKSGASNARLYTMPPKNGLLASGSQKCHQTLVRNFA